LGIVPCILQAAVPENGTYVLFRDNEPLTSFVVDADPISFGIESGEIVSPSIISFNNQFQTSDCQNTSILGARDFLINSTVVLPLSNTVRTDDGSFTLASSVILDESGGIVGIEIGSRTALLGYITFSSTTTASLNLISAFPYFPISLALAPVSTYVF